MEKNKWYTTAFAVIALVMAATFVLFVVLDASQTQFVPRGQTTTVVTTTAPAVSSSTSTTTADAYVQLAPNGPGTGSCLERLPSGEVVEC